MSKKMTAALLIVSLSFNLAILGVFLYKQFVPSPMPYAPRHIPPPFRAMGVDEQQREQLMTIMRSFRRENHSLQMEIRQNEKALMDVLRRQPGDSAAIDSLVTAISRLREEHSRRAMKKLSEAGKLLDEEQRGLLLDMLMRSRMGRMRGKKGPPMTPPGMGRY